MTDYVGYFGGALLAGGMYLATKGWSHGFLMRCLGHLLWVGVGVRIGMDFLIFWGTMFFLVDLIGYVGARLDGD